MAILCQCSRIFIRARIEADHCYRIIARYLPKASACKYIVSR